SIMRKFFVPFILIFLPLIVFSQNKKPTVEKLSPVEEEIIFQKVTPDAGPIDPVAWNKYLQKNTQLPDSIARQIPKGTYK
ncbi:hypothetical protein, partial [Rhizobium leguminosarum]|uniref:hypothetical protein n=1 Tax=Rhizobium leguminosarum TaxID=384 RepID=UPI003F94E2E6